MLNMIVAGDICMRGQEDTMNAAVAREVLKEIQPQLDRADFRLVNWENPTTLDEGAPIFKSGPALHSKPANLELLTAGRFDAAVLASNTSRR